MFNKKERIVFSVLMALIAFAVLTPVFGGQETGSSDEPFQAKISPSAKIPPSSVPVLTMPSLLQPMGIPAAKLGIFVLKYDASIKLLDAKNLVTYGPYLKGQLGTTTSGLNDAVLDKKGKTAIVSNYSDQKIFFISLAKSTSPAVLGSVTLGFSAADIALSPNGKFALVTGGGTGTKIASLNVKTRTSIQELTLPGGYGAQAVAVAKDNQTVVTADYGNKSINYFLLNPATGLLTYQGRRGAGVATPINIVISPDGKTVFAMASFVDQATCGFGYLYLIVAPGNVTAATQRVPAPSVDLAMGHGAVFSKDGKKLYVLGSLAPDADGNCQHVIYVFNVTAPGTVAYSGVSIKIFEFNKMSDQLFGTETMALTPDGKYIFLSNHGLIAMGNRLAVVDLKLNAHVYSLIACDDDKAPAGMSFKAF